MPTELISGVGPDSLRLPGEFDRVSPEANPVRRLLRVTTRGSARWVHCRSWPAGSNRAAGRWRGKPLPSGSDLPRDRSVAPRTSALSHRGQRVYGMAVFTSVVAAVLPSVFA